MHRPLRLPSLGVPTGRVVVPTGRYVVPAGKVIIIVSPGRLNLVPTGRILSPGSDNDSDDASVHSEPTIPQQQRNIQPQIITTVSNNNAKFPYLKKDEYEVWAMKMEYWITNNDMNIWKVIQNGNSLKRTRRDYDGRVIILSLMTANKHIAVQRESKARTTLLQSIPDDHVADFHYMDDARDIWNAVKARFGGNAESKKMRKSMLKQEFSEFRISEAEGLHKGYDRMQKILSQLNQLKAKPEDEDINLKFLRALPSSWSQVALTLKTKGGLELLSFDDLYYKLKTLEVDIKGYSTFSSSQSAGPSHSAFVSTTSASKKMSYADSPSYTSSTYTVPSNSKTGSHRSGNIIEDVLQSFVADTEPEQQLAYEDFDQIEKLDLEEMDLKWEMAMLSVRVHKFEQKAGRKIDFDKKESARFNKKKEIGKKEEDSKALITIDTLVDWIDHDGQSNGVITSKEFGMIAGCDTEDAIEEDAAKIYNLITGANIKEVSTAVLQKNQLTLEDKIRVLSIELENTTNLLKHSKRINAIAETAKKDLQTKLDNHLVQTEKWRTSSKNLFRLVDSSISVRTKLGLGFNNYIGKNELGWDDSAFSVFTTNSEEVEGRPHFNRFAKTDSMKVVPPPLSGDYTPLSDHTDLDESQMSYGTKSSTSGDSNSVSNDFVSCDNSDKSSEVNSNDFASSDSSVKTSEPKSNDSTSCASTSSISTSESEAEIESYAGTPIQEPIIVQDLPSFSCNSSDKNENTSRTSCNKNGYFNKKASHFRKNNSSTSKSCFVCGSYLHLIKDCNYYETQYANDFDGVGYPQREPIWDNATRVTQSNHFGPFILNKILRPGKVSIPAARPNQVRTGRPKPVSTGRPKPVSTGRPKPVSTGAPVSTGKQNRLPPVHAARKNSSSVTSGWWQSTTRHMAYLPTPTSSYFQTSTPFGPHVYYNQMRYAGDGWETDVKPSTGCSWRTHRNKVNLHSDAGDEGIVDSGCSRSMTGNKERLANFQPFKGGKVTFGGGKGQITGKRTIRTPKLDFENVYYVKELQQFNLFSVSQICDKKNRVLFTDTDCLVLSNDYNLPDESMVLLRVPRKHNLYTFNLNNLALKENLACLVANASSDEAVKWHRRMGHVNYKNMNKLVKDNLVREFKNAKLIELCGEKGIKRDYSNARTPLAKWRVAERKNRTLIEAARTMLADSKLPTMFWTEAVSTACYVLNRVLVTNPHNKTPYALLTGKTPSISHLNPFGCHVAILNTSDHLGKFDGKADEGYLVGYSASNRAYREKANIQGIGHEWSLDLNYLTDSLGYNHEKTNQSAGTQDVSSNPAGFQDDDSDSDSDEQVILVHLYHSNQFPGACKNEMVSGTKSSLMMLRDLDWGFCKVLEETSEESIDVSVPTGAMFQFLLVVQLTHSLTMSVQQDSPVHQTLEIMNLNLANQYNSSSISDYWGSYFSCANKKQVEPRSVAQALKDPSWVDAMQEEMQQFKFQNVWVLVNLPEGKYAIRTKQEEGIDYDEVFAPVARIEAIRLFLAFASYIGFMVYQMDVKSAFLYRRINEEVYVTQPKEIVDHQHPKKVYKVVKALYGLHQAPRAWYATLSTFLLKHGYRRGTIDKTLFLKNTKEISSCQDKYVQEILKKFDLECVRTATTPYEAPKPKSKNEPDSPVNVHLYRSMIGSLMYLTASRPDIMFAVSACSRNQVTPTTSNLEAVKKIFKYLKGQPRLGLWYPRESPFVLEAYSDSDYAGANKDRKSTTGGCQFLGRRLISWQCKKQTIVATSSTEAEYVAAANCCGQVLWIQNQLLDYGYNFMNTKIFIDNQSTICIVKNPVFHQRTKHIEIRHHFIRDANEKKLIQVLKIHTDDNVADLLTKAFDGPRFTHLVVNIGMLNP
ncbi:putative ribonuclease H-like domain-containing protein [Tanacetum coccineum]